MRRFIVALSLALLVAGTVGSAAQAGQSSTGNGAPSGPHFTLNIHGVAGGQEFNGNNQNDIFTALNGHCFIGLVQAVTYDFKVLDPNCVADNSASFELPAPCAISTDTGLCTTDVTLYSVYARALGTPGGHANVGACGYDGTTWVCSINAFVAVIGPHNGRSTFDNVSRELLFVTTCVNGKTVSTPLFSQNYQGYLWDYDNQGLRLAQLRFYQVPSDVPTSVTC